MSEPTITATGSESGRNYYIPVSIARTAYRNTDVTQFKGTEKVRGDSGYGSTSEYCLRGVWVSETPEEIFKKIEDTLTITLHGFWSDSEYPTLISDAKRAVPSKAGDGCNIGCIKYKETPEQVRRLINEALGEPDPDPNPTALAEALYGASNRLRDLADAVKSLQKAQSTFEKATAAFTEAQKRIVELYAATDKD